MEIIIPTEARELLEELAPRYGLEAGKLASVWLTEKILEGEMMVRHGLARKWEAV